MLYNSATVDFVLRRARDTANGNIHPMGALTRGMLGEEMTEIGLLKRAGAVAFSNGKNTISNTRVMRNVLTYAKDHGALVVHHEREEAARTAQRVTDWLVTRGHQVRIPRQDAAIVGLDAYGGDDDDLGVYLDPDCQDRFRRPDPCRRHVPLSGAGDQHRPGRGAQRDLYRHDPRAAGLCRRQPRLCVQPVSYTHLPLPTIYHV